MMRATALTVAFVLSFAGPIFAQGASQGAPGQQSGDAKKDAMPGQSGYAPGHQSGDKAKDAMPGQSGYAPGQNKETTGQGHPGKPDNKK